MKKLLTILFVTLTLGASAQKGFVQGNVSAGATKVVNVGAELGVQDAHNRVSVVGNTYDATPDRRYQVGVKYARVFPVLPSFKGVASIAALTDVHEVSAYVVEPGVALEYAIDRKVSILAGVTAPIAQTTFGTHPTTFSGGLGLKVNL